MHDRVSPRRILLFTLLALLFGLTAACGGGDGGSPVDDDGGNVADDGGGNGAADDGDDSGNDGGSNSGDGGSSDGSDGTIDVKAETWSASLAPGKQVGGTESVVLHFTESMQPDSLEVSVDFADSSRTWSSSDNSNDTLTLAPEGYWPPGSRDLAIKVAGSADSGASKASVSLDVSSAFSTFQLPDVVIGQQDFASGDPRRDGEGPDADTLNKPIGPVAYDAENDILFISDSEDARVLGFRGIPDVNGMNADFVLGQPDFTTARPATSQSRMFSPQNVTTDGGRLMVTDNDNNRVLVYDGISTSGNALPALVVGQDSMDERIGACDSASLIHVHAHLLTPDGKLLVSDSANNRVLVWDSIPTENGHAADHVLGQSNFTNCSYSADENFRHPTAMWSDGDRFVLVDSEKHRILIWNHFPTSSFQAPDVIVGQKDMAHHAPNDKNQDGATDADGLPDARTLSYPRSLWIEHGQMFVADMDNHRVLVWNEIPDTSFAPADIVIGQENFTHNVANAGAGIGETNSQGFQRPVGVTVVRDQLFVTEWENSRVLIFNGR